MLTRENFRWDGLSKAIKTLPSGGHPNLVSINVGFWELKRLHDTFVRDGQLEQEDTTLTPDFVANYRNNTASLLRNMRTLVGDSTRIRWRQMHTPLKPVVIIERRMKWMHPRKIKQLNEAAKDTIQRVSGEEVRRRNGKATHGEDGRVTMFPIGDIISPYDPTIWLQDSTHPSVFFSGKVWGEGALEFLSRTPTVEVHH
jgi:hypothetical protein